MEFLDPIPCPVGGLTEMTRLPDGKVAGINGKAIVERDPATWEVTTIASEGGQFLACDGEGRLYFARGAALFRLTR